MDTINKRIRKIRIDFCNDSNIEFAKKMDKNPNTVNNWVRDGYPVGLGVASEIASKFPVNANWIMKGDGEMLKTLAGAEKNPYLKGANLNNENEEPLNSNDMEKDFLMKMLEGSQSQIEQFLSQQEKMLSQQDELISIIKNLTSRKSDEADSKKKPTIGDRSKEKGSIESPTESK